MCLDLFMKKLFIEPWKSKIPIYIVRDVGLLGRELQGFIRSDNGTEFSVKVVRYWLGRLGVQTLFIEPGSPWENGYN